MLNWLKALILSSITILFIGCPTKDIDNDEELHYTHMDYDSLYKLGDSVLKNFYETQAAVEQYHDSLHGSLSVYETKLKEKHIQEEMNRIVYKDSIVKRVRFKEVIKVDTIKKEVVIVDTIRDTVEVSYFQWKKKYKNR